MTIEVTGTTVEILGKTYQFKCPVNEIEALQKAAKLLDEKMQQLREVNNVLSLDRLAVLAALTMTHQIFVSGSEKDVQNNKLHTRLQELINKLDTALFHHAQQEFNPSE